MGEVWRARDSKLGREVAIKTLPEEFARDEERLARFEREAKLLASLNHPNIATIHGLEEDNGTRFLVLELVEGDTLADRLKHGAIPVEESLKLALQIAEALEAAHENGVIHRDLKPANIKITPEGKIKVLDFGLAKALTGEGANPTLSNSPTISVAATQQGVILGTPAYMSPEQAKGRDVDRRADIWAFGCVLFEMLTGRQAFGGEDTTDVIVRIMRDAPDLDALKQVHHVRLASLVRRCLRKDLERRYHHIGDVRVDLEDAGTASDQLPVPDTPMTPRRSAFGWGLAAGIGAAFILGALALSMGVLESGRDAPRALEITRTQLTSHPAELAVWGGAISPDGTTVIYSDPSGLYREIIATGESSAITLGEDFSDLSFSEVSWFPDGTRIIATGWSGLTETTGLYAIPIVGGRAVRLADGWRAAISPDGTRIAYLDPEWPTARVWVMGANGEDPIAVVTAEPGEQFWQVAWSPDNQRIAFGALGGGFVNTIETVRVDGDGDRTTLVSDPLIFMNQRGALPFVWLPDGRLLYTLAERRPNLSSSNLWTVETSLEDGTSQGEPVRITNTLGTNVRDIRMTTDGQTLSILRENNTFDVHIAVLADGGRSFSDIPERMTLDDREDLPWDWTPDSSSLLFSSNRGNRGHDIYRQELNSAVADLIVADPAKVDHAQVSPDGTAVLYARNEADRGGAAFRGIFRRPLAGGAPTVVFNTTTYSSFDCTRDQCVISQGEGVDLVFYELDPIAGLGVEVARTPLPNQDPEFVNWALSHDGTRIALTDFGSLIRILDISSEGQNDYGWTALEHLAWTAGGNGLFVVGLPENGPRLNNFGLLHVDDAGEATVVRHQVNQWYDWPESSPDGRYLAFAFSELESNVWMIEGL